MPFTRDELTVLDRFDRALDELHNASKAVLAIARRLEKEAAARDADDDEWTRLPSKKARERCRFSNWSIATLERRIASGEVRRKRVAGTTFYSGSDVRRLIHES